MTDLRRRMVALTAAAWFLAACSPSWPRPVATVDQRLSGHAAGIARVDVLPVDLSLWTDGRRGDPDALRLAAEDALTSAATTALYQRGYLPGAQLRWDGSFVGDDGALRTALTPGELQATTTVLAGYHDAAVRIGGLPQPPLPARLGASGAEATLYVGGWAYVGEDPDGDDTAVKVLVIAAVVVVAVVVAVALAKGKHKGSGLARAADAVADAAVATGRIAARGLASSLDASLDLTVGERGAYGGGAWQPAPTVAWSQRPELPRRGRSALYLEMTMVDNRDGHVLWHVAQRFPASGGSQADVTRAAEALLSTLPKAR